MSGDRYFDELWRRLRAGGREGAGGRVAFVSEDEIKVLRKEFVRLDAIREFVNYLFLNTKMRTRMFSVVTRTWNPITGCTHLCVYCWAKQLAETKLREHPKYREGFVPRFHEYEMRMRFNGGIVFVSDMGDMFCRGVPDEWIRRVLDHIRGFPETYFLLLTKNPARFHDFVDEMPRNAILGATIETNRDDLYYKYNISGAPPPSERYEAMKTLDWPLKFISIEPILDFDLEEFAGWVRDISPFMVYVGYDNYNHRLPEPPLGKTEELVSRLSEFTLVIRKSMRRAWFESDEGEKKVQASISIRTLQGILNRVQKFKEIVRLGELVTAREDTRYNPQVDSEDGFTYNKWTLLKLMFLQLYTPLYTKILKHRYAEINYIDLFAGSGVNRFEDTDIILAGSPIIALSFAAHPFSNAYMVDTSSAKLALLERRVELLKELSAQRVHRDYIFSDITGTEIHLFGEDANKAVHRIYDAIEERHDELLETRGQGCHNLVFIDPFGFEFQRASLERILRSQVRSDILILFNSYGAGLAAYNAIHRTRSRELDKMLGENWIRYVESLAKRRGKRLEDLSRTELSRMLLSYYTAIFERHSYVVEVVRLPLRLASQQFDLIFACRRTRSGNRFLEGVRYIEEFLRQTDYRLVDELKSYIKTGRLPGLLNYMIKDPEGALNRYKTARRYGVS